MAFEMREMSGSLFKNSKKESDNHPDYTGQALLDDGRELWLSAWIKETKNGGKFMSLAFKVKDDATPAKSKKKAEDDDRIPF